MQQDIYLLERISEIKNIQRKKNKIKHNELQSVNIADAAQLLYKEIANLFTPWTLRVHLALL